MSGVSMDEKLVCTYCMKRTNHHTDSEKPFDVVWAQCMECLPGRLRTAIDIPAVKYGKVTYYKVNRRYAS